jgi:hypothetical protein
MTSESQSHRELAEQLLADEKNYGYPNLTTETVLRALVHAVLALRESKA